MALDAYDTLVLSETGILQYYPNDESTGTSVADAANGRTLTLGSGTTNPSTAWGARTTDILPAFSSGHQALDFNGTNGHATYSSATGQPPITTGMLIEGWVRMDSSQSTSPTIMGNTHMVLQQFSGRFYVKIGSAAAAGNVSKTVGTAYHIMMAWSGGASGTTNWTLYVNGVSAASGTVSVTAATPNYTTVGGHWNGTLPFDGVVSRFAVYSGSGVYAAAASLAASHYDAGVNGISAGESYSGSGTLDGSATVALSGTGQKGARGTGASSDTVSATGTGQKSSTGNGALTGTATVTGTGAKSSTGTGVLSGTVATTGTGQKSSTGSGVVSETVTTTGTGSKTSDAGSGTTAASGSGVLSDSITLSGSGNKSASGTGALASAVTATGTGRKTATGSGALAGTVTLTGTGVRQAESYSGSGVLASTASLSGTGLKTAKGSGALSSTTTISGEGFSNQISPPAYGLTRYLVADLQLRTLTWSKGTFTVKQGVVDIPTILAEVVAENWIRAGILHV